MYLNLFSLALFAFAAYVAARCHVCIMVFYLSIRVSDTVHISFVSENYMNDDACIYTNRYRLPPICPNWTSHIVRLPLACGQVILPRPNPL